MFAACFSDKLRGAARLPLILIVMALAWTPGCAQTGLELITDDSRLLESGNNFYARQRFTQAGEAYRKVMDEYPDSRYRRAAIIGLADSLYKEGQFEEANLYYERFVEMYPLDELTPRALFYFAMCHMMLTSTSDRSQKQTKLAIQFFDGFIKRYPDHMLAATAAWNKEQMQAMLVRSKLDVARFYYNTNKNTAAIDRLKEYVLENPDSTDTPEALFMLGESFMREQAYRKAAQVFTMLIGDNPDSEWAKKAKESAARLVVKSN